MMTKEEEIQNELHTLKPGDTRPLEQVLRYCKQQKRNSDEFWEHIPKPVLNKLDKNQLNIIEGKSTSGSVDSKLLENDAEYQLLVAEGALNQHFLLTVKEGQQIILRIVDVERKIVYPIYENDGAKALTRQLSRVVKKVGGKVLRARLAKDMVDLWINHVSTVPMPTPAAGPNDEGWSFHRPHHIPDKNIELARWSRILSRMSDPEAFAAWIWGVYSGDYKGRQMLWLHGKHGEDGKSAIAKLLATELFGPAHHAISNASLGSSGRRFLSSFFEHARLVIYPDASNRRCLMSEAFKMIASAGADPVLIERKGKQAYTSTLQARMWVCSNYAPEITDDNFAQSRLLYLQIDKMKDEKPDPKAIDELKAEIPGFLYYAEQAYEKLCRDNYEITTLKGSKSMKDRIAEDFYEEYEVIFHKHWELCGSNDYLEASRVRDVAKKEGLTFTHDYKNFIVWLVEKKGVVKRKISQDGGVTRYEGMRKRRPQVKLRPTTVEEW